jgi:hypothetical protein
MKFMEEESKMKKCRFEESIDDYLFNRLEEKEREAFEEHYFNCPQCFEKMTERDELVTVIKARGETIFRDVYAPETSKRVSWVESVYAFLTPRQWAAAAAAAALILVVALGIIPNLKTKSPEFFINEDLVRGSSITLISPVIGDLNQMPSEFRWQSLGENTEYKLFLFQQEELIWTTSTQNNFITLTDDVKKLLFPGQPYSWQVKAFSPGGTLISVSSRVQFQFSPKK